MLLCIFGQNKSWAIKMVSYICQKYSLWKSLHIFIRESPQNFKIFLHLFYLYKAFVVVLIEFSCICFQDIPGSLIQLYPFLWELVCLCVSFLVHMTTRYDIKVFHKFANFFKNWTKVCNFAILNFIHPIDYNHRISKNLNVSTIFL